MKTSFKRMTAITAMSILASAALPMTPALASTTPSTITVTACTVSSATTDSSTVSWTLASDTLTVTNNCSTGGTATNLEVVKAVGAALTSLAAVGNGLSTATSPLGATGNEIRFYASSAGVRGALLATVTATSPSGGGGGSSSSSAGSAPTPVVQQFGKPAVGTCDEAAPSTLNWANVSSGGWGESWSQWMNGGAGGFVCTRTLVYSTATAKWVIG